MHHRSGLYWSHFRCWFNPTVDPPPPKLPSASGPAGASSDSDLLLFFVSVELEQKDLLSEGLSGPGPTRALQDQEPSGYNNRRPSCWTDRARLKICLPGGGGA